MRTALIVCATAAIAAAATATAGSLITSKNIKDRTIQPRDLSKRTLRYLKGNPGPRGEPGPMGPQGTAGETGPAGKDGVDARHLYAVVNSDGALVSGNAASAERVGTVPGGYAVTFDQNISTCSHTATLRDEAGMVRADTYFANGPQPTVVFVGTFSSSGASSPRAFNLTVTC